ncbi:Hypothetical predicted protein [Pelobates cultripes]|uniref:Uncharacterized protein n=1 Tax=Pelobates cultripes TaxID=61616 RepID=A0AAD1S7R2_PELCU|nr:Hypothetical predicted protein [Pelobates cultripes]CAH2294356.1 Hypothetical predicted protein [Pelobates cultripes]
MADATSKPANMGDCGEQLNNTMNKLDAILAAFWTRISESAQTTADTKRVAPEPQHPALTGPRGRTQSDSHQRLPNKVPKTGSETQTDTQSLSQYKHPPPAASKPHQICGTQLTKTAPTTQWNNPATP